MFAIMPEHPGVFFVIGRSAKRGFVDLYGLKPFMPLVFRAKSRVCQQMLKCMKFQ